MATLFWDCEEVILVDAMPRGETTRTPTSWRWQNSGRLGKPSQNLFGRC
jgi:hypothetical protein